MPELPEVEALADHLRRHAVGLPVGRVDVSALSVLKTFDPPLTDLYGQTVTGASRWGKYLGLDVGDLHLITHLSRAGWLRWSEKLAAAPLKPGKGPIGLRVHLGTPGEAPGFDLTEAGTQKRLAVWLVTDPAAVPGIATLGPDALALDADGLAAVLAGNTGRIKTVITDQKVIAGIGNAYSDEILHTARLSPFATAGKLTDAQLSALHDAMITVLTDAVRPSYTGGWAKNDISATSCCTIDLTRISIRQALLPEHRKHGSTVSTVANDKVNSTYIPQLPTSLKRKRAAGVRASNWL